MAIKAILIAVSNYNYSDKQLPLCKNDLKEINCALQRGLKVESNNIYQYGEDGTVTVDNLIKALKNLALSIADNDTFIFFFSGHGNSTSLCLSDNVIKLQDIIEFIEKFKAKNKIIFLDCCYSGNYYLPSEASITIEQNLSSYVEHGCAVLASCASEQKSTFHQERKISLFTSFLSDALTDGTIIRKGKKSLEDICNLVRFYSKCYSKIHPDILQTPTFRSNIPGSIFFDVEPYTPYIQNNFYRDTEKYIIYKVEPCHTTCLKRYCVKVILKDKYSTEQVQFIIQEIVKLSDTFNVYSSQSTELLLMWKATSMIAIYFGYDEIDMNEGIFASWCECNIDTGKVTIHENKSYFDIKALSVNEFSDQEYVNSVRVIIYQIIDSTQKIIGFFHEYENQIISESLMFEKSTIFSQAIHTLFIKLGDMPVPSPNIRQWMNSCDNVSSAAVDIGLYYNENRNGTWDTEIRKTLMNLAIKNYNKALIDFKEIDKFLAIGETKF